MNASEQTSSRFIAFNDGRRRAMFGTQWKHPSARQFFEAASSMAKFAPVLLEQTSGFAPEDALAGRQDPRNPSQNQQSSKHMGYLIFEARTGAWDIPKFTFSRQSYTNVEVRKPTTSQLARLAG